MAWIKVVEDTEFGELANILKLHSLRPDVLKAHLRLYRSLMFADSDLTRRERETIAVAVSVLNQCHY